MKGLKGSWLDRNGHFSIIFIVIFIVILILILITVKQVYVISTSLNISKQVLDH